MGSVLGQRARRGAQAVRCPCCSYVSMPVGPRRTRCGWPGNLPRGSDARDTSPMPSTANLGLLRIQENLRPDFATPFKAKPILPKELSEDPSDAHLQENPSTTSHSSASSRMAISARRTSASSGQAEQTPGRLPHSESLPPLAFRQDVPCI